MPWQFRKSVKIFPGVRLNFSKRGVGYSIGGRAFRYTVGATGRRTRTIGIPGTGISHVETLSKRSSRARATAPTATTADACPQCQAPISAGQPACTRCGLNLDPASLNAFYRWQAQQQEDSASPIPWIVALAGLVLALACMGTCAFLVLHH